LDVSESIADHPCYTSYHKSCCYPSEHNPQNIFDFRSCVSAHDESYDTENHHGSEIWDQQEDEEEERVQNHERDEKIFGVHSIAFPHQPSSEEKNVSQLKEFRRLDARKKRDIDPSSRTIEHYSYARDEY